MGLVSAHVSEMASDKLRRRVAQEAAKLMYGHNETQYARAKFRAARRVAGGEMRPEDLPTRREIRDRLERFARTEASTASEPMTPREEQPPLASGGRGDRFRRYEMLLLALERVKEHPKWHPEGDALYHSLQVFELARQRLPYDEEFLLAALLHDVGKAIDGKDHVEAGLEALDGSITPRCAWLIEHHAEAHAWLDGTLGARSRRRLSASEDFEELLLLARCDRQGRAQGVPVPDVRDALEYLRELSLECGE